MKIDILTLFPDMVKSNLQDSIIGRATKQGVLEIEYYQIRDYSENKQKKVDDTPYGGGPGMLMTYQPIKSCFDDAVSKRSEKPFTIYMSPKGRKLSNSVAKELSEKPYLVILCGHYEGVDERVIESICDDEISIGDYVLTGGELPASVLVDTVSRFIPGVLGRDESSGDESFEGKLLEYPQYTKPFDINGMKVPEVLISGNQSEIEKYRKSLQKKITKERRPDLYQEYDISEYNKNREIYLDNSATTKQTENVTEVIAETARKFYGNPSSLHRLGMYAEKELRRCREELASIINCDPSEIIFTSGGSESNNLAIKGYFLGNKRAGKHIIISAVEHPSVTETAKSLESFGISVSICPVDKSGVLDLQKLKELITPETSIISCMMVNSEVGTIEPIAEISKYIRENNLKIVLHTDCVQSFGKLPIDVKSIGCDMISVSAHKIHGPRGVGFLYVKKGIKLSPLINGGGQENGLRSSTENLPGIVGMTKASLDAYELLNESYKNVSDCRNKLISLLSQKYGEKFLVNTNTEVSLPYILNISFAPLRAEVVLHSLESKNVFVSVGSACSSHKKNRSPVLTAMGVPINIIDGSIRISFSRFTRISDIDIAFDAICETIKELKRASYKK